MSFPTQRGGVMRLLPTLTLITASVWGLQAMGQQPQTLEEYTCMAKAVTVRMAFDNREDGPDDDALTTDDMIEMLRLDWEEEFRPKGVPHAAYVDMQRLIRDITRTSANGEWRMSLKPDNSVDGMILGYYIPGSLITAEQAVDKFALEVYNECMRQGW